MGQGSQLGIALALTLGLGACAASAPSGPPASSAAAGDVRWSNGAEGLDVGMNTLGKNRSSIPASTPPPLPSSAPVSSIAPTLPPVPVTPTAVVETSVGAFTIALDLGASPLTVAGFERIASSGGYAGRVFSRIEPGFLIQIDQPAVVREQLPLEPGTMDFSAGAVGMARNEGAVDSANGTFFVLLAPRQNLARRYNVFGSVTSGMDVVQRIATLGASSVRIESVTVTGVRPPSTVPLATRIPAPQ